VVVVVAAAAVVVVVVGVVCAVGVVCVCVWRGVGGRGVSECARARVWWSVGFERRCVRGGALCIGVVVSGVAHHKRKKKDREGHSTVKSMAHQLRKFVILKLLTDCPRDHVSSHFHRLAKRRSNALTCAWWR
jgi:hypothetical protein